MGEEMVGEYLLYSFEPVVLLDDFLGEEEVVVVLPSWAVVEEVEEGEAF
jgi:hypothetical protein